MILRRETNRIRTNYLFLLTVSFSPSKKKKKNAVSFSVFLKVIFKYYDIEESWT